MHSATATLAARPAMPVLPAPPAASAPRAVSWAELTEQRAYLVHFARRRLQDPALAEDLVHDVFEAVASGRAAFGGRAALRSWLVGILKHKIVDLVRQRSGHDSLDGWGFDSDDAGEGEFEHRALECPQPRPDEVAEQRQHLARTMARIAALPAGLRRVVELRLLHERNTDEICRTLAITEQNLFVRLHRARRVLAA